MFGAVMSSLILRGKKLEARCVSITFDSYSTAVNFYGVAFLGPAAHVWHYHQKWSYLKKSSTKHKHAFPEREAKINAVASALPD